MYIAFVFEEEKKIVLFETYFFYLVTLYGSKTESVALKSNLTVIVLKH